MQLENHCKTHAQHLRAQIRGHCETKEYHLGAKLWDHRETHAQHLQVQISGHCETKEYHLGAKLRPLWDSGVSLRDPFPRKLLHFIYNTEVPAGYVHEDACPSLVKFNLGNLLCSIHFSS